MADATQLDEMESTFLSTEDAAALLHIAPATLTTWRCLRRGPNFRRHGSRVVYARRDLLAWSDAQLHRCDQ
jgi:hypothetical protein